MIKFNKIMNKIVLWLVGIVVIMVLGGILLSDGYKKDQVVEDDSITNSNTTSTTPENFPAPTGNIDDAVSAILKENNILIPTPDEADPNLVNPGSDLVSGFDQSFDASKL